MLWIPWGVEHNSTNASCGKNWVPNASMAVKASYIFLSSPKYFFNSFGERFLPRDAYDALCATPRGIQSIYRMMQSMEPDVPTDKNKSETLTDSDLRRMMRDPKYWRDNDTEYIRKIENGFKKLYS